MKLDVDRLPVRVLGESRTLEFSWKNEAETEVDCGPVLAMAMSDAPRFCEFDAELTFWRLGNHAANEGRHLEAYYHFWFTIERTFGEGAWRKNELVPKLQQNAILRAAVHEMQDHVRDNPATQLTPKQRKAFIEGDADYALSYFFNLRGDLHHAKPTST
jgi:hypothetical protein